MVRLLDIKRTYSIVITPALDVCIMANDGTWGPWL